MFCVVVGVLGFAVSVLGNYLWYPAALLVVFVWTWMHAETEYFWVFALGMGTAFAEIIGKFRDEPLQSVRTSYAILYHIFNGIIAVCALCVLEMFTERSPDAGDQLKKVLVAGLGAMLIMRSKLFNIKIADQDVSFGPEQIIKIFLSYMEEAIDRIRATERLELVNREVDIFQHDRFNELADYVIAKMASAQTRTMQQKTDFEHKLKEICSSDGPEGVRNKCFSICFELLNAMGEDFALEVFESAPPEIRHVAPQGVTPSRLKKIVVAATPFTTLPSENTQYYMAYGPDMSGVRFRERLKWSEEQFRKIPAAKRCELAKYCPAFNHQDAAGSGWANIVPNESAKVEGVLYTLSKEQIHFLDKETPNYTRRTMSVIADGRPMDAENI